MRHDSSAEHRRLLAEGLVVLESRDNRLDADGNATLVRYSDESYRLFTHGGCRVVRQVYGWPNPELPAWFVDTESALWFGRVARRGDVSGMVVKDIAEVPMATVIF